MPNSISMLGGGGWAGQINFAAMRQQRMEKLFAKFDTDGSGSLSKDEFTNFYKSIQTRMSQAGKAANLPTLDDLFKMADSNGDGNVTKDEMANMFKQLQAQRREAAAQEIFKAVDTSDDGTISKDELTTWLQKMQAGAQQAGSTEAQPQDADIFKTADTDGNGQLSLGEFAAAFGKGHHRNHGGGPGPVGGGTTDSTLKALLDALAQNGNSSGGLTEAAGTNETGSSLNVLLSALQQNDNSAAGKNLADILSVALQNAYAANQTLPSGNGTGLEFTA
jgi:Ca2+-binding EF-hand superfamily protein